MTESELSQYMNYMVSVRIKSALKIIHEANYIGKLVSFDENFITLRPYTHTWVSGGGQLKTKYDFNRFKVNKPRSISISEISTIEQILFEDENNRKENTK